MAWTPDTSKEARVTDLNGGPVGALSRGETYRIVFSNALPHAPEVWFCLVSELQYSEAARANVLHTHICTELENEAELVHTFKVPENLPHDSVVRVGLVDRDPNGAPPTETEGVGGLAFQIV